MDRFRNFRDDAVELIERSLGAALEPHQRGAIEQAVEQAMLKTVRHTNETAVDVMLKYPLEDQDKAHKLADEMRRQTEALIANLTAQR